MRHTHAHPSDRTLMLALDRELSVRRQRALDQHLAQCAQCRTRRATFASIADETARLWRQKAPATAATDALRRRLTNDMAVRGARWNRSVTFQVRRTLATLPVVVRVGASIALLAVGLPLLRSVFDNVSVATHVEAESLPIPALTPGATGPVDRDALCAGRLPPRSPIASTIRDVVLRQYRMERVPEHEYELDYLITPELGGTADPRNLWPERYAAGIWNARVKDDLEELLPRLVCEGSVDLKTAQQEIAGNWIAAYKKYLKTDRPITRQGLLNGAGRDRPGALTGSREASSLWRGPRWVSFVVSLEARAPDTAGNDDEGHRP